MVVDCIDSHRDRIAEAPNNLAGRWVLAGLVVVTQTVIIRPAEARDREAIWPLARDFATSLTPRRARFDLAFDAVLGGTNALLLVAEVPGPRVVIGYLMAFRHVTFFANGPVVWVEELMVAKQARRSGVGRALMEQAERWSESSGATYLALATRRAADFYLALGYRESATFFRKLLDPAWPEGRPL